MSMLFKFITTMSIFSVCSLISSFNSINLVISLFLVLSVLKTLNDLSISSVLICYSFTSCLSVPVWIHLELTSVLSHNFFLFNFFTFVCTLSSLFLLSLFYGIIYWFFRDLLCIEIYCTIFTLNLWQNPFLCHCFYYLIFLIHFCSLSSVLICSFLQGVLLCHTYSTF